MQFVFEKQNNMEYYTVPKITEAGFYNIFTTKFHGHSFAGKELNFGTNCGDTEDAIIQNYTDVLSLMDATPNMAVKSKQTHSDITLTVDKTFGGEGILKEQRYPEADGLITTEKDLAILIFFADCVPVLIADPVKKISAAIHSGWKGTQKNIVGKAVMQLFNKHQCNPKDLLCAIGPSISICHFEVSEDLYDDMTKQYGNEIGQIRNNKFFLDLKKTVTLQLTANGIPAQNIAVSDHCTVCEKNLYSFRREGEKAGRMAAFIKRRDG